MLAANGFLRGSKRVPGLVDLPGRQLVRPAPAPLGTRLGLGIGQPRTLPDGGEPLPVLAVLAGGGHLHPHPFPLLDPQLLLGGSDGPLGGLLLGSQLIPVGIKIAAVNGGGAVMDLHDHLHQAEQGDVVADHHQPTVPITDPVVQPCPGGGVEVVGRLVEKQGACPVQFQPGQGDQYEFPSREGFSPAGKQILTTQAGNTGRQQSQRTGLDVPVVPHDLEVGFRDAPGLDGAQGAEPGVDPEELGDGVFAALQEILR